MEDRTEAIAKFLRLNYGRHGMDCPRWEDAAEDERTAWLEEASYICGLADRRSPNAIMIRFTEPMIDAVKPFADADHYTVSTWIRAVIAREIETRREPGWVDDGSLSLAKVSRRFDEVQ